MNRSFARGALITALIFIPVLVLAALFMEQYWAGSEFFPGLDLVLSGLASLAVLFVIFGIVVVPINHVGVIVLMGQIQNSTPLREGICWVPFWAQVFFESLAPRKVQIDPIEFEFEGSFSKLSNIRVEVNVDPERAFQYFRLDEKIRAEQIDARVYSIAKKTLQRFIDGTDRPGTKRRTVREFKAASEDAKTRLNEALNDELYEHGVQACVVSLE